MPIKATTTPRQPQDHKPKAAEVEKAARVLEIRGVSYTLDEDALDDFELLGDLRSLDSGGTEAALSMPRILKAFLGADQYRTALDSIRDKDTGRVGIEAGAGFVGDLLKAISPN